MRTLETDYLVVGAGAAGMSFVDVILSETDADVIIVDRRHIPGGHWIDSYPFVRLHQPSAVYGVPSRTLGNDRIDEHGPNAGFYERATGAEICAYYLAVLEERFLPSGRVRFLGMTDHLGEDDGVHRLRSLVAGDDTEVVVRRKVVDCTYVGSEIPSKHTPPYLVDDDVTLIPPNDLVDLAEPASGYTLIGAGKTSMDACNWLLEQGVDPDRIRWIRPRDVWMMDRGANQPLELVGAYMQLQADYVTAAAEAEDAYDFANRLETAGTFHRIDPAVEPDVFRGAIVAPYELAAMRTVTKVVRGGHVQRIGNDTVTMSNGSLPSDADHVYVNCTARGVNSQPVKPLFTDGRITMQIVTLGIVPYSASLVAYVEATRDDDAEKNRLCPVVSLTGTVTDMASALHAGISGTVARLNEADISAWNEGCRLNPGRAATQRMDDPTIADAFGRMFTNVQPALDNLARLATLRARV